LSRRILSSGNLKLKTDTPVSPLSGIPGMDTLSKLGGDSYTTRESFKAFNQSGKYIGAYEGYGSGINNKNRLFYSTREPIGVWWVRGIAGDIWDNWFRVVNPKKPDDDTFDRKVQKTLRDLKARIQLPRETVFERRYGTAILLCSYTGFGEENEWKTPLFDINSDGTYPKTVKSGQKLLQITPYTWPDVTVSAYDKDENSIRCGYPEFYTINRGGVKSAGTSPTGQEADQRIEAHWSRVIHDAPRLDEHPFEGLSALDVIFDDLVGGRNARWGAYESYYRHGTGFPVIKTNGTAAQNAAWIASGGLDTYLNVRGYFVCNVDESFEFVGAEGKTLDPNTYFNMYFTFIAAGTGVASDSIKGVSSGRVTGSEVNERQYYKSISLHQNQKEPMLRELIDRIIQTKQVKDAPPDYDIEWVDPFEVNPQDKAAIEFMQTRTIALKTWITIDEARAIDHLDPLPDGLGEVLMSMPGQMAGEGGEPAPNQKKPTETTTEPEEGTPNNATLLDRTLNS